MLIAETIELLLEGLAPRVQGLEAAEVERASASLADVSSAAGPPTLYHLLSTETPHKSLAYPAGDEAIDSVGFKALWAATSPLLARQRLAADRPAVTPDSRGMVINGKFDLLLEGIKDALGTGMEAEG